MVTPLVSTDALDEATFNARFDEVQAELDDLADGTTATTPNISDYTSAQHDHQDAAGGGQLTTAALSSSGLTSGQALTADGAGGWSGTTLFQVPSGVFVPYAGSVCPSGWLLCAGQAVSRTTYATLFAAISTTYGAGDGSTTFNLPNLRGRVPLGMDNMNGTSANVVTGAWADTLGGANGTETHTLSTSELPAHTHGIKNKSDYQTLTAGGSTNLFTPSGTVGASTTESAGSGAAHNNIQPSIAVNYIIKT